MRQSQTYIRKKYSDVNIDPNDYGTYRNAIAYRIIRKRHGDISRIDAWQLAAIPAFFLWALRGPIHFFKKKKVDRAIKRKLAGSNKQAS